MKRSFAQDWVVYIRRSRRTECEAVALTHGFATPLAGHLRSKGLRATTVRTRFGDESEDHDGPGVEVAAGSVGGDELFPSEGPA